MLDADMPLPLSWCTQKAAINTMLAVCLFIRYDDIPYNELKEKVCINDIV